MTLVFYGIALIVPDSPMSPFFGIRSILFAVRQTLDASVLVGVTRYYEIPMGEYGPGRLALLCAINASAYTMIGATVLAARRITRWFYVLTGALVAPFVFMGGYLFLAMR
jgi:hypothetical protein